jgi:hypothetical protein
MYFSWKSRGHEKRETRVCLKYDFRGRSSFIELFMYVQYRQQTWILTPFFHLSSLEKIG